MIKQLWLIVPALSWLVDINIIIMLLSDNDEYVVSNILTYILNHTIKTTETATSSIFIHSFSHSSNKTLGCILIYILDHSFYIWEIMYKTCLISLML